MAATRTTPSNRSTAAALQGRPPQSRTDEVIRTATRELLVEVGVHGLTVESVAARTGIAKTTIYRRYRSKNDLALAVLADMVGEVAAVPDLGDTRAELVACVDRTVRVLSSTPMGRVMQGLVSDLASDAELAKAFRERVVGVRLADVRLLVERGIVRGDLRRDTDAELLNDLLIGPVYYRLLLSGAPLDRKLGDQLVSAVLPNFVAAGAAGASRR